MMAIAAMVIRYAKHRSCRARGYMLWTPIRSRAVWLHNHSSRLHEYPYSFQGQPCSTQTICIAFFWHGTELSRLCCDHHSILPPPPPTAHKGTKEAKTCHEANAKQKSNYQTSTRPGRSMRTEIACPSLWTSRSRTEFVESRCGTHEVRLTDATKHSESEDTSHQFCKNVQKAEALHETCSRRQEPLCIASAAASGRSHRPRFSCSPKPTPLARISVLLRMLVTSWESLLSGLEKSLHTMYQEHPIIAPGQ